MNRGPPDSGPGPCHQHHPTFVPLHPPRLEPPGGSLVQPGGSGPGRGGRPTSVNRAVDYFGSIGTRPDTAEVDSVVERLGMNRDRPFHKLSTGGRRKVGLVSAVTAAFYPSLTSTTGGGIGANSSGAMSSVLGLGGGINPSSPVGFLWSANYSNQLPWLLMALGIALGTAAIAGDESEGTLEYLLATPVTRTEIAVARFADPVTITVSMSARQPPTPE